MPASFLADGPATRTVKGRIIDKDGGFTDYTTSITVNNVAPIVNAGADDMAFSGVSFSHPVTFTDPGTDSPWTVRVDWNGDTVFDETFNVSSHSFNVVHTYGPMDIGNTYGVVVEVNDNDGGVNTDTFNVLVVANTFRVSSFATNPSGFTATFNRAADLSDLNLYDSLLDGSPMTFDPADVTLVQTGVGPVSGSMVWNAITDTLTFVKTGDVLAAGNYTVTLISGARRLQRHVERSAGRRQQLHRGRRLYQHVLGVVRSACRRAARLRSRARPERPRRSDQHGFQAGGQH